MIHIGSELWDFAPNLVLCIVLLLVLRRQTVSHRVAMAKLEALKRSLDALSGDDGSIDPPAERAFTHSLRESPLFHRER